MISALPDPNHPRSCVAYWDGKGEGAPATQQPPTASQNMTQGRLPFSQVSQQSTRTQDLAPTKGRRKLLPIDEDSDGETAGPPPSQRRGAAPATRTQPSQSTTQRQSSRLASEEPPAIAKRKRKAPEKAVVIEVNGPIDLSLASDSDAGTGSRAKRARRATSSTLGDTERADDILPARSTRSSGTRSGPGATRRKLLPVDDEDEGEVSVSRVKN